MITKPEYQQTLFFHRKRFYGRANPDEKFPNGICLYNSNDYHEGVFIIAADIQYPSKTNPSKIFTAFPSYIEYHNWINTVPLEARICYEVIPQGRQKSYFDIDIEFKENKLDNNRGIYTIEQLGDAMRIALPIAIANVMRFHNVNYSQNQLLMFNSNRAEKQSIHVVIDGWSHEDHINAKAFMVHVKNALPLYLQRYIDETMCKKTQQFRMIGNHKLGKNNVKVLDTTFTSWKPIDGATGAVADLRLLEASLVTTSGCTPLPPFVSANDALKIKKYTSVDTSLYEAQIISMYKSSSCRESGEIGDFKDGVVTIVNSKSFNCPIHNRIHNDNPMLLINNGQLYWDCRRPKEKGQYPVYIGPISGITSMTNADTIPIIDIPEEECGLNWGGIPIKKGQSFEEAKLLSQQMTASATSTVGGSINILRTDIEVHDPLTGGAGQDDEDSLYSMKFHSHDNSRPAPPVKEGQTIRPSAMTTISSFLDGNTKFAPGTTWNIQELPISYDRYRCGAGAKCPNINGGILTSLLTALGHNISKKYTNGSEIREVTFKAVSGIISPTPNIDVSTLRDPTTIAPIQRPTKKELKKAKVVTRKEWYDQLPPERLNGDHTIDMSPTLPSNNELVGAKKNYLLFMKTACGMGKTELIKYILQTSNSYLYVVGRVLLGKKLHNDTKLQVTKKREDGTSFTEWVNEAKFYADYASDTEITVNKGIVTIDSLWRVKGKFEYLILDECSYAINQLVTFSDKKAPNSNLLLQMLEKVPKVIVADACLKQSTVNMLANIRNRNDVTIYENHYPKHSDKRINEVGSVGILYAMIEESVRKRENIIIPIGSASKAEDIAENLKYLGCAIYREDEVPNPNERRYKVKIYTGNDRKFGDPTGEFDQYNCIIFTSVLEAGNSFTKRHFHKEYAYFTSDTFGPCSAVQMTLRSRQYIDGEIYVFVRQTSDKYPSNVITQDDMKHYIKYDSAKLRSELREGVKLTYDNEDGIAIDFDDKYFDLFAEEKYRDMIGKRNYADNTMKEFKFQGMAYGKCIDEDEYCTISGLVMKPAGKKTENEDKYFEDKMVAVCDRIKCSRQDVRNQEIKLIEKSKEITQEEYKILDQGDTSREEKASLAKFRLKKKYGFKPFDDIRPLEEKYSKEPYTLTPAFVDKVMDESKSHTNVTVCQSLSGNHSEEELTNRINLIVVHNKITDGYNAVRDNCMDVVLTKRMYLAQGENKVSPENLDISLTQTEDEVSPKTLDLTLTNQVKCIPSTVNNDEFKSGQTLSYDELLGVEALFIKKKREKKTQPLANVLAGNDRKKRFWNNIQAVDILRIIELNTWLRTENESTNKDPYPMISRADFKNRHKELSDYARGKADAYHRIPEFVKLNYDENLMRKYVNSNLEIFKLKLMVFDKDTFYLRSFWQLDNDGIIRPNTYIIDPTKSPAISEVPDIPKFKIAVNSCHKLPSFDKKIYLNVPMPKGRDYIDREDQHNYDENKVPLQIVPVAIATPVIVPKMMIIAPHIAMRERMPPKNMPVSDLCLKQARALGVK